MYLLFDADQTIWDFNETERISLSLLFSSLGLPDTQETKDAYMTGNLWCWDAFEKGIITLEELEEKRMSLFFQNLGRRDLDPGLQKPMPPISQKMGSSLREQEKCWKASLPTRRPS